MKPPVPIARGLAIVLLLSGCTQGQPPAAVAASAAPGAETASAGTSARPPAPVQPLRPEIIQPPKPPPVIAGVTPRAVLGEAPLAAMAAGRQHGEVMTLRLVRGGVPFEKVLRAETVRKPTLPYHLQATMTTQAPVRKGEKLLLTFYVRGTRSTDEFGEAKVGPCFEKASAPHTKSLDLRWRLPADRKWRRIDIPFVARESYPAAKASFNFRLGYEPQTVEIAALSLANYGQAVSLAALPRTPEPSYHGREAGAAWRAAAAERIEKHRKADLLVRVTDAAGRPAAAEVAVAMTRHAFGFGTAINHRMLFDERRPADRDKYRAAIRKLFNKAVIENGHKWGDWAWENPASRKVTLDAVKWLREAGIEVRGHCILWPNWRHMPRRLPALKADKPALRAEIDKRIREVVAANKGTLTEWDVVNEMNTNHEVMDILGNDVVAGWFKLAGQTDPACQLYVNDYSVLTGRHVPGYERWIRRLLDANAPLGGIGIQGHLGGGSVTPRDMLKVLDRMAKFRLPLQVTELDVLTGDRQLQADYLRDVLTVMFSHPAVEGVIMWGFWDGSHWKKNAPLYYADWRPKPALAAYEKLIFHDWWTQAKGKTDAKGLCRVRAFLGEHKVSVTHGGRTRAVAASLPAKGATVTIALKD